MSGELLPRDPLAGAAALVPRALRAWWVGLLALFAGLAGTAIWVVSTKRMYRSEAVIVYERPIVASLGGISTEGSSPRHVGIQLQDMVNSRLRLEKQIKEMKLYPAVVARRGLIEATEEMRKSLGVGVREGYTFRVSYESESRDLAQQVLTRLVQSVVDDDTKRRGRDAEQAKVFLDKERQHADDLLREKESALAGFLTRHPELAAEGGTNASPGGSIRAADRGRASDSSGEVASLEMQAAQIEMQIAEGSREGAPGTPQAEPPDPILAGTRAVALGEVQAAERALLDKQARFTDEHPDVKLARWHLSQVQAKLKAADAALAAHRPATKAAAAAPAGGGENSPAAARAAALKRALAAVRSQLAAVKTRGARTPAVRLGTATVAVDTEWSQLARAVMEARDRQEQMEARQFQAQLLATLVADRQAGGLIIADPPFRPVRPVSGGRFKIALVGGAAAVVLAALAMLITALLDRRLYDRRDVERIVGSDVIVVVTRLALKPIAKPAAKLAAKPARTGA